MDSIKLIDQRLRLFIVGVVVCFVIAWWLIPTYRQGIAGVVLGLCVSYYNVCFLGRKIKFLDECAVKKHRGTGMIHRFSVLGLAIFFGARYPQWIDVRAIVLGVPMCYLFLFFSELFTMYYQAFTTRRG